MIHRISYGFRESSQAEVEAIVWPDHGLRGGLDV
jgi:hypothetical protein